MDLLGSMRPDVARVFFRAPAGRGVAARGA
jgi:hypothetical protein